MKLSPSDTAVTTRTEPADVPADALDDCAQEEIRLPGSVQRHGFLLGLNESQDSVILASQNAEQFLGVPMKLILGGSLDLLLERELLASVKTLRCAIDPDGLVSYLGAYQVRQELFSVVTHCIDSTRVLEFERQDRLVGAEMMNAVITNFVGTLARLESPQELCEAFTKQFAALTGFDRVLLYSFDEEGHGTVLTEANSGRLPSYLDLRFPATDIPVQARQLYVLNTVRIIPDATYTPSPIVSIKDAGPHILDLSLSVLRSVSPLHLEYMRNMGTISSMSVSIVVDGKLWGLVSGHHAEPRTIPYLVRSACDMLSKMVGTQLNSFRTADRLQTLVQFHGTQRQLLTRIAAELNYLSSLSSQLAEVQQVTHAAGAVFWDGGTIHAAGSVPGKPVLRAIVDWLGTQPAFEVYATRHLSQELPEAADAMAVASGLLAIRISDAAERYLLWFKPEVLETVTWAGEPIKRIDADQRLHPRKSFQQWQETFHGQSVPWSSVEVESAREFRAALVTISLQRLEEEAAQTLAQFQQLSNSLPTMIFTCDAAGVLGFVNTRWRKRVISTEGEWFGGGRLLPEDEERCRAAWKKAVDGEREFEEEVRVRVENPNSAQREHWHLVRAVPFRRQGAHTATGWIGFFTDLTERKEREDALRMAEKLALTGRMTSVIAHEINNPLESITNLMYLLRQTVVDGSDAASYIGMAESELDRISGITKQTLRWNRESRTVQETFAADILFEEVIRLFQGKTRNRNISLRRDFAEGVVLYGVLSQIRQVVANLVSNALDAAPVGGNVSLRTRHERGGTTLTVIDDGAGIPDEVKAQLFQPFISTKGDLGNGLGLYISHEIVERHGGTLRIASGLGAGLGSGPGSGTTATVHLPHGGSGVDQVPLAPSA